MLKNRIVRLIGTIALAVALTGGFGIVADALGLPVVPSAHACETGAGAGGGC